MIHKLNTLKGRGKNQHRQDIDNEETCEKTSLADKVMQQLGQAKMRMKATQQDAV